MANNIDISDLPPPPPQVARMDVSDLPPPPKSAIDVSDLPPPPAQGEGPSWKDKLKLQASPSIRQEDFEAIGEKHGVDPEELKKIAPFYGVKYIPNTEDTEKFGQELATSGAKEVAGSAGRALGGLPQFLYKKAQKPEMRAALDELNEIGSKQRSYLQSGGEMVSAPVGILGKTAGAGARIAEAGALGAGFGLGESKEGEELKGAARGAAFGTALGAAGEGLGKLLAGKKANLAPLEQREIRRNQFDIQSGVEDIAKKTEPSEKILEETILGGKETYTPQEAEQIAREQYGDEALQEYLDGSSSRGEQLRERMGGESISDADIYKKLADEATDQRVVNFAEKLTKKRPGSGEEALEEIQKVASRQGEEQVAKEYKTFVTEEQANRFIDEHGLVARDQPGIIGQTINKLSDNQYPLRDIDDRFGMQAESAGRELGLAKNRLTFARQATRKDLEEIFQLARKNGTDAGVTDGTKIYDFLEGKIPAEKMTREEIQTAQAFRNSFDNQLDFANHVVATKDPNVAPLNIPKRENYVPHIAKPLQEQIPIVEKMRDQAVEQASQATGRDMQNLNELSSSELNRLGKEDGPIKNLVDYVKWADNSVSIKNGRDLARELDTKLNTKSGQIALQSRARSLEERTGEVPDFILEKNLYKLKDSWDHNTLNHLYLRQPLSKLNSEAAKLRAIGAHGDADFVSRIGQDALGLRKGTPAEGVIAARVNTIQYINKLIDKYGASSPAGIGLRVARSVPDMMQGMTRLIYPNMLGAFNLFAAARHAVAGITRVAPELGGAYGYTAVLRGTAKAALNFREYYQMAEHMGNVPAEFIRQGEAALAEGIARSKAFNLTKQGYEGMANAGMALFRTGEKMNRAIIMGTTDMIAHDLSQGVPAAINQIRKNFPNSVSREILRDPGNVARNTEIIGKYLNETTLFNYSRSNLFEFGRSLGPVLSAFSKWPTAMFGEAAYTFRSRGLVGGTARNLERLVAPYLLLSGVMDHVILGKTDDDFRTLTKMGVPPDVQRKFIGRGFGSMAPIGALHEMVQGRLFSPPAVDVLFKGILVPALEGKPQKALVGLDNAVHEFSPISGPARFITDDMVTYITGHRPEGKTFTERTLEGARIIGKNLK